MSVSKKVAFHVKQISSAMGISDATDSNVERLVNEMLLTYQEYKLEPKNSFKNEVAKALQSILNSSNSLKSTDIATIKQVRNDLIAVILSIKYNELCV